jgi:hypothetical protein
MLKVDLHMHSREDPCDALDYSARDLIRHAASLDFDVIALTLHGKVLEDPELPEFAASRGLLFIQGIEKRIHGKEVLVYNVTQAEMDAVHTFEDLRQLKRRKGNQILIIAPHPFFKRSQCLGRHLEENIDVFDAIEYCHLYTSFWNLNRRAVEVANSHRKTLIATSDTHALWMLGHSYSWVEAQPTIESLFHAVRAGRVKPHSEPMTPWAVLYKLGWAMLYHDAKRLMRDLDGKPTLTQPAPAEREPEQKVNPTTA